MMMGLLNFSDHSDCTEFGICWKQDQCWDGIDPDSHTANCWILWVFMLSIGSLCVLYSELTAENSFWHIRMKRRNVMDDKKVVQDPSSPFTETLRTEHNFLRNHSDPNLSLPSSYDAEYSPAEVENCLLPIRGFRPTSDSALSQTSGFRTVFIGSMGWGMICSSGSTLLWLMMDFQDTCLMDEEQKPIRIWIEQTATALGTLLSDFTFYPIFLLTGCVSFVAFRWREWMRNCHALQGAIHNVALMCGGSFIRTPTMEQRKLLYRIYRHLNGIHALCYKSISPSLSHMDVADFCDQLNLLSNAELKDLSPYPSKAREALLATVSSEIAILCSATNVAAPYGEIMPFLAQIRAHAAKHHDFFVQDNPNLFLHVTFLVVNTLIFWTLVSFTFTLLSYTPRSLLMPCFQPYTWIGVTLILNSYRGAFLVVTRLRNPFKWTQDCIKVDNLMASTDMHLFTVLRSSFKVEGDSIQGENDDIRHNAPLNVGSKKDVLNGDNSNTRRETIQRENNGIRHMALAEVGSKKNVVTGDDGDRRRQSLLHSAILQPKRVCL